MLGEVKVSVNSQVSKSKLPGVKTLEEVTRERQIANGGQMYWRDSAGEFYPPGHPGHEGENFPNRTPLVG